MIQSPLGKLSRNVKYFGDSVRWALLGSSHQSVYFYTLHKCASSLFAGYVLPNAQQLKHVHYARKIYRGKQRGGLQFHDSGHIYGPIRVSSDRNSAVYRDLVQQVVVPDFAANKKAVFLVRDPRDILVSAYYSFGYHHKLGLNRDRKLEMLGTRAELQGLTVDEFALKNANFFRESFELLLSLSQMCGLSIVLKYEDLISDFDNFISKLQPFVRLTPKVVRHLHKVSRPNLGERQRHRRSGTSGAFQVKLQERTIIQLNDTLGEVCDRFGYLHGHRVSV